MDIFKFLGFESNLKNLYVSLKINFKIIDFNLKKILP